MDRLGAAAHAAAAPGGPMRIALLGVAKPQASRLSALFEFPHEFVDATEMTQSVDAAIALRFGPHEARRYSVIAGNLQRLRFSSALHNVIYRAPPQRNLD